MKPTLLGLSVALMFSTGAFAQKVRLLDGDMEMLKNVRKINVQFDYNSMGVGKFATEQEYITKKKDDYNKKEAGRGES